MVSLREVARRAGRSPDVVVRRAHEVLPPSCLVIRAERSAPASVPVEVADALAVLVAALPSATTCATVRDPRAGAELAAAIATIARLWESST